MYHNIKNTADRMRYFKNISPTVTWFDIMTSNWVLSIGVILPVAIIINSIITIK
jgi:hypothetical protein